MEQRQAGFTLIEILVAFAIGIGALAILWRLLAGDHRALASTARQRDATLLAEDLLDEALVPSRWPAGLYQGALPGGYGYELQIVDPPKAPDGTDPLPLQRIDLRLRWDGPRGAQDLVLHSLRPTPVAR